MNRVNSKKQLYTFIKIFNVFLTKRNDILTDNKIYEKRQVRVQKAAENKLDT